MKIIITNKFRNQMEDIKNDFTINWESLYNLASGQGVFESLRLKFEVVQVKYDNAIGYSSIVLTDDMDEIVYAKRKGASRYTRFVLYKEKESTNIITFMLNRSDTNNGEYYLCAMILGRNVSKEPEDLNIKSKMELNSSLEFWSRFALVYNEKIIDVESRLKDYSYRGCKERKFMRLKKEIIYTNRAAKEMKSLTERNIYDYRNIKEILSFRKEFFMYEDTDFVVIANWDDLDDRNVGESYICKELNMIFGYDIFSEGFIGFKDLFKVTLN